jgi:hypothetical protein
MKESERFWGIRRLGTVLFVEKIMKRKVEMDFIQFAKLYDDYDEVQEVLEVLNKDCYKTRFEIVEIEMSWERKEF